ncbi:MAG: HAD family phosphatase [Candidatus Kerfeldbacteria bacterium]|nr:HAD family phosphatase [Candidatus Kerfeldbacteria bacterium]
MTQAILFDLDGLLVDTETLGIQVAIQVCKELSIELTHDEQKSFIGVTDEKFYRELFKKRTLDFNVGEILAKHFNIYDNLLKTSLTPFRGADELPEILKNFGFKIGLVSGSTRNQILIILNELEVVKFFDVIVSCEDITQSKPNPEGYLIAADELQLSPKNCLVLEDAETGVIAGKKAGMRVIGVKNKGDQNLSFADITVDELQELVHKDKEFWVRAFTP